ncbi:hypothetical protein GCM10025868_17490 [Angustibacter aerolatus]|uniref:ANTAR domain-containing protein n=1 Tax=Angustibacter aerolatus TaxID=1162965 RepID=A0ABQ6JGI6_9ACTN|nr:hypothetical protein GCM10025868_17490 [Angustibacter aerolatus]
MAGYRIVVEDRKVGALNLFSDRPGGFTRASGDAGVLLAAFATTALAGASEHARAESLSRGLQSNREIGTAVGLLMATHGVSADRAFEVLRETSSEPEREGSPSLARRVVADAEAPR